MKSHLLSTSCLLMTLHTQTQALTTDLVFTGKANNAASALNSTVHGAMLTTNPFGNAVFWFNRRTD